MSIPSLLIGASIARIPNIGLQERIGYALMLSLLVGCFCLLLGKNIVAMWYMLMHAQD